jgi:hypothetical protein
MISNAITVMKLYGELMPLDEAKRFLSLETDATRVADFNKCVELARMANAKNEERRNYFAELAIWTTRRLGELIAQGQKDGVIASETTGRPRKCDTVSYLTVPEVLAMADEPARKASSRAQQIASIPAETVQEYIERQKESGEEISKASLMRFATGTEKAGKAAHVSANTGIPEWYTPPEILEAVRAVLVQRQVKELGCC